MLLPGAAFAITPPGTVINNTATATFDLGGATVTISSNTVGVQSTVIQTPSSIAMYQFDFTGSGGVSQTVPTQHATAPGGGYVVSPDPVVTVIGAGSATLDPNTPLPLGSVVHYQTGEPVFINVDDDDQNLDPSVKETVVVIVTSTSGDTEELVLTETGPDTGIFSGYVQSVGGNATAYDGLITLGENANVSVSYTDKYHPNDTSGSSSVADPRGRVFNSLDGSLLDGMTVSLLDSSGNPATVFGDDGVSSFPGSITTGGSVTDSGGKVYDFATGEYRFPRVAPGDYRIVVTVPASYQFPSIASIADLQTLPGAPFALDADASYGSVFTLPAGPPLVVDIAIDPLASRLILEKTASKDTASIGDFVRYSLSLENIDTVAPAANTVISDRLPLGFRYQKGSLRLNGTVAADPVIAANGRDMQIPVGTLLPSSSVKVAYVTELSSGTPLGRAVNSAVATDVLGLQSNTALASINVEEDLFASRSFIAGRVIVGDCETQQQVDAGLPGLPGIRVFMEDGSYAATDQNGMYHFEGVRPGTHVVQVDLESIPDNLEIVQCVENTRYAGTPYSQFVDIRGGSLWRADFYVREKPPLTDTASLFVRSELSGEVIKYTIDLSNGDIPVDNYRLVVNLPEGVEYEPGSSLVDAASVEDPYVNDNALVYRLGDPGANWNRQLTLRTRLKPGAEGELTTTAIILMNTGVKKNIRSSPVRSTLDVRRKRSTQQGAGILPGAQQGSALDDAPEPGDSTEVLRSRSEVSKVELEGQPEFVDRIGANPVPRIERLDISMFDEFWIKTAEPGHEWLMPSEGHIPDAPSTNIAIKHHPDDDFEMLYNGEPVNPLFYFGTIKNASGTVARSYWQGIHLLEGENRFDFIIRDSNGEMTKRMTRVVHFTGRPVRAEIVEEYSRLVADGSQVPLIAIRLYDSNGLPARPGSRGKFLLSEPYLTKQEVDAFEETRLTGLDRLEPEYQVGADGLAVIVLEPTTRTGRVEITLPLTPTRTQKLETWLRPELRDWILVGVAEGTAGYKSLSGNLESLDANGYEDDFYQDGKIAFYAKGRVRGDWLLTTAFDSERNKRDTDNRVNQVIDPNTYYTIYGDASRQRWDASTADKLYIKIERDQFYALYGDMETGLTITELSRFSRRMTGLKSEGRFGDIEYTAFGAENLNDFVKDEIQGQGISGLYRLSGKDIVINSDAIVIETRDRFRSEIIIERRELKRYIDYNIDYQDGTLYFREPVPSRDSSFNPVYIVADYEVETPVDGDITAGGRGVVKLMDGQLEVGGTYVHDGSVNDSGDLVGADARMHVTPDTQVYVEVATTDGEKEGKPASGSAYLVQAEHESEKMKGRVYLRQQDEAFGLGQQSVTQSGTRKYGAEGSYRVDDQVTIDAKAYHEDVLATGADRNVAEATALYGTQRFSLSAGGRMARDGNGGSNNSDLLLLGASTRQWGGQLELRGNAEISLGGDAASADYPSRYIIGADYFITPKVNLFAENEWTLGRDQDTQMARAGVRATPWQGAQVNSSVNQEVRENGLRTFATLGLTQSFKISERLNGDFAIDQSRTMRTPGADPLNPNVPVAQGTADDDFTAVSVGTTYFAETWTLNNRVEFRNSEQANKKGLIVDWERILMRGLGYSARLLLFDTDNTNGTGLLDGDIQFSLGYRPLDSRWIALNKLEFKFDENTDLLGSSTRQRKLINNFVGNFLADHQNQVSFNYGVKYVVDSFDGDAYNGMTHLLGSEYRRDLNPRWDVGGHVHTLYSANAGTSEYSYGVSVGWNLARNIWLSGGYNFEGFEDGDFSAAGYTAHGPYVRFRMKFDQDTAKMVNNWLN